MSELRQDPSSGDWVIIAPGRAARPAFLDGKPARRRPTPKSACPFEHPEKNGNWPPVAAYPSANPRSWRIIVIPNKYPVLQATGLHHGAVCSVPFHRGIYFGRTGVGSHELAVTRDHNKNFGALAPGDAKRLFRMFQARARAAAKDPCLVYVVPFFNWGAKAGASVWHPHYQILSLPVVPSHSARSIEGAASYFQKHRQCVRCTMAKAARTEGARVVGENRRAIAIAPYASKIPFEVRVLPKTHQPFFYKTPRAVVDDVAALLQSVMRVIKARAGDPDLNFYVHEAPVDGKRYDYHHWHVEVLPRLSIPAGFEFSTGVYVNVLPPETAASILRGDARSAGNYH